MSLSQHIDIHKQQTTSNSHDILAPKVESIYDQFVVLPIIHAARVWETFSH